MSDKLLGTSILFIISAMFAFILVVSICTLIDKKLSNISIAMPKVNPPDVNIYLKRKENGQTVVEHFKSKQEPVVAVVDSKKKTTKECKSDKDCNIVWGNGKNVCKSDKTCQCVEGTGDFCHIGPTNYKDPADMSHNEREAFKKSYRKNFTLQDYINWLKLYRDDNDYLRLREEHRINYKKLLAGKEIKAEDMPEMILTRVPRNDMDYFSKMYTNKGNISYPHDIKDPSPLLAFNYSDYSEFIPPQEVREVWHTGIVDLYKDNKFSAKALNSYLRPDANLGAVEKKIGDNYLHGNFYLTPPGKKYVEAKPFFWVD